MNVHTKLCKLYIHKHIWISLSTKFELDSTVELSYGAQHSFILPVSQCYQPSNDKSIVTHTNQYNRKMCKLCLTFDSTTFILRFPSELNLNFVVLRSSEEKKIETFRKFTNRMPQYQFRFNCDIICFN